MIQSIIGTLNPAVRGGRKFKNEKRNEARLHIFDARPMMSALGNKVMGSGYENIDNYPSTWLCFCDIENIHKIRESYIKLTQTCNNPQYHLPLRIITDRMITSGKWLLHLDRTDWLQHLSYILSGANMVVDSVRVPAPSQPVGWKGCAGPLQ